MIGPRIYQKKQAIKLIKKKGATVLARCGKALQNDYDVVIEALSLDGDSIKHTSKRILADKNACIVALQRGGVIAYRTIASLFPDDHFLALLAVRRNGMLYPELTEVLQNSPDIVKSAITSCPRVITKISNHDMLRATLRECLVDSKAIELRHSIVTTLLENNLGHLVDGMTAVHDFEIENLD